VRTIAVEEPGHKELLKAIDAVGLRKVSIPVDGDGLRMDLLGRSDAGAVLVTPAHQYPTGAVLAPQRRAALLAWAVQRKGIILEDDYDAEYRYDREPIGSLQGRAPDRVIYIGTASKVLAPALRLGWLALPPDLVADAMDAKRSADHSSPIFDQLALADFIERGELDRHLRRTRLIYRRRRDRLVAALASHLPTLKPRGIAAGLHMMVELGASADERKIVEAAARKSISLMGVRSYRSDPDAGPSALLLGFGWLTEPTIDEAVRRLGEVLREHDVG
jgi:GntR family transcriptional regulator/MocR family aminotransferase